MPRVNENLRKAIKHVERAILYLNDASRSKRLRKIEKTIIENYVEDMERAKNRIEEILEIRT